MSPTKKKAAPTTKAAKKAAPAVKIKNAQRAGHPQWPAQPGVPPPQNL